MSQSRPPPATWAPGAIVPGTVYRIIRPLGAGGMGEVYEAEHELLGVRRALKVLSRKMASREDLAERLRVEARALAGLRHPNLVQVYDLGVSTDGRVFFAMELLEGMTLREMLRRAGRLKPEQATAIAVQVLEALDAAHERGMVHRDVKPENVFLLRTGAVKLLDFGVAKAMAGSSVAQPLTAAGMAVGTPRYMSPEQAEGQTVDARSDLYAVGVLLWEMLAGKPPFHHLDGVAAAVATVTRGVPSLSDAGIDDVPSSLVEVIRKATARSPQERLPTAAAFAAELRMGRARNSATPSPVEKVTVRYEQDATSLVPLMAFSEASDGGDPDLTSSLGGQTFPGGRTSQTSVQTEELTALEASAEATELRSSLPFDLRNEPTPTALPLPRGNSQPPSPPSRPAEQPAPPAEKPSAFPLSFWIGTPMAVVLTATTMWLLLPQFASAPPQRLSSAEAVLPPPVASVAPPVAAPATSASAPPSAGQPAASGQGAEQAAGQPPAEPAPSSSALAEAASGKAQGSKKAGAKSPPTKSPGKTKAGGPLPSSGL